MRGVIKKISHPFLKLLFNKYHNKPRKYSYSGVSVMVHPDVFPPHFTLSTKILLDFISALDLANKTLLELGCGSGIISLYSASKGAKVTATDINPIAVKYLISSSKKSSLEIEVLESDLFQNIDQNNFDYIIINPPYYPKNPENVKEKAWFCGENFNYFENLFCQIQDYLPHSNVLMILSEDCELDTIKSIANENKLSFTLVQEKKVAFERNFIFSLNFIDSN